MREFRLKRSDWGRRDLLGGEAEYCGIKTREEKASYP